MTSRPLLACVALVATTTVLAISPPVWPKDYTAHGNFRGFFIDPPVPASFFVDSGRGRQRVDFFSPEGEAPVEHTSFLYLYGSNREHYIVQNLLTQQARMDQRRFEPTAQANTTKCFLLPIRKAAPGVVPPLPFANARFVENTTCDLHDGKPAIACVRWRVPIPLNFSANVAVDFFERAERSPNNESIPVRLEGGGTTVTFVDFTLGAPDPIVFAVPQLQCLKHEPRQSGTLQTVASDGVLGAQFAFNVSSFDELNELTWPRTSGFGGGDGGQSHALPGDRLAMNFDDGGFGYMLAEQRISAAGLHNFVAIVHNVSKAGWPPRPQQISFHARVNAQGNVEDFYQPEGHDMGDNFFWAAIGPVVDNQMLSVGTHLVKNKDTTGVLLHVTGVDKDPSQWTYVYKDMPQCGNDCHWGNAHLVDGMVHFLAKKRSLLGSDMVLARISLDQLRAHNFDALQYWARASLFGKAEWLSPPQAKGGLVALISGLFSECTSLEFNTYLQQYVMPLIDGDTISLALSPTVTGPYKQTAIYKLPAGIIDGFASYCAISHPALTSPAAAKDSELVLSFFTNEFFEKSLRCKFSPDTYIERFLRVELTKLR